MAAPGSNPLVFIDLRIGEEQVGRVVLELFQNYFPNTVKNFLALVTGTGRSPSGRPLSYRGTRIFKVIPRFALQGGDVENDDGTGSETIYGKYFPKELPFSPHDKAGLLGMASNDSETNGSQFYITTVPNCTHLDGTHTVFGQVLLGMGVIGQIDCVTTHNDVPIDDVIIENCGIYQEGMPLGPEDPCGEDMFPPFPEDCPPNFINFRSLNDVTEVAKRVRLVGNFYYKKQQYVKANSKYKKALRYLMKYQEDAQSADQELSSKEESEVTQAVIHNLLNSAACKIKLQMYEQALENCNETLDFIPNHPKALYRRGQAYHGKREYDKAISDLMAALQLEPNNCSIIAELKACRGEMATYKERERRACQKYFQTLGTGAASTSHPIQAQHRHHHHHHHHHHQTNGSQLQQSLQSTQQPQQQQQQPEAMMN